MKKLLFISLVFLCAIVQSSQAQDLIIGKWQTIDDATGKPRSVVEIYEEKNKIYGKVISFYDKSKENKVCDKCEGAKKDKPIKGMVILEGAKKNGSSWEGGTILDPTAGKVYKCIISMENKDKLEVRGYIGISLFGRTQYWERIN